MSYGLSVWRKLELKVEQHLALVDSIHSAVAAELQTIMEEYDVSHEEARQLFWAAMQEAKAAEKIQRTAAIAATSAGAAATLPKAPALADAPGISSPQRHMQSPTTSPHARSKRSLALDTARVSDQQPAEQQEEGRRLRGFCI